MPDRWTEERERRWRERSRRGEAYGRGDDDRQGRMWGESRSWGGGSDDDAGPRGARFEGGGRDRVFGEEDTGAQYNRRPPEPGGGAYGAGGSYGAGEGYGPDTSPRGGRWDSGDYGRGGRDEGYGRGGGGYDMDVGRGGRQPRFQSQDYTRGGRFYGDDRQQPIYREEYGQGGRDYGPAPRGYDADRYGAPAGGYAGERDRRGPPSGGTGGYDYERGYGDGGRQASGGRQMGRGDERPFSGNWQDRDYGGASPAMMRNEYDLGRGGRRDQGPDNFEGHARSAGEFLNRAGERISSWFSGLAGEGGRDQDRNDRGPRRYSADFGREERWEVDRGHRGRGPKNYARPDERINDEAHERLTEDHWLDASQISVSVSGGEITLSGTVESREAKHRAERLVEDITGVKHVQNNLRIDRGDLLTGSGSGFGDSAAEAKMRNEGANGGNGGTASGEDSAATRSTTRRT